jgi:hypothetical protein
MMASVHDALKLERRPNASFNQQVCNKALGDRETSEHSLFRDLSSKYSTHLTLTFSPFRVVRHGRQELSTRETYGGTGRRG